MHVSLHIYFYFYFYFYLPRTAAISYSRPARPVMTALYFAHFLMRIVSHGKAPERELWGHTGGRHFSYWPVLSHLRLSHFTDAPSIHSSMVHSPDTPFIGPCPCNIPYCTHTHTTREAPLITLYTTHTHETSLVAHHTTHILLCLNWEHTAYHTEHTIRNQEVEETPLN